jgi:hypothetical protein
MTKHAPSTTEPPVIVIQETDDDFDRRKNILDGIESRNKAKTTTKSTTTTTVAPFPDYGDYNNNQHSGESINGDNGDPEYNENNYDLLDGDEEGRGGENVDSDEYSDEDYDAKIRRKRLPTLREKVSKRHALRLSVSSNKKLIK